MSFIPDVRWIQDSFQSSFIPVTNHEHMRAMSYAIAIPRNVTGRRIITAIGDNESANFFGSDDNGTDEDDLFFVGKAR